MLPNYGTVETANTLPPLRTGQKFRLATAGVFDWAAYPFNGVLAAIAQAKNDPKSWGQGWEAYGKRYGASFADNSIGTYMTTAIFPSLLKEDPRYYQMRSGPFFHRFGYSLSRLFVTRTDAGGKRFNYSESVGNATAAAISNIYHADEDRIRCAEQAFHVCFSDSLRWFVQRVEGILARHSPQSVTQESVDPGCAPAQAQSNYFGAGGRTSSLSNSFTTN